MPKKTNCKLYEYTSTSANMFSNRVKLKFSKTESKREAFDK